MLAGLCKYVIMFMKQSPVGSNGCDDLHTCRLNAEIESYDFTHDSRGICYIMNNYEFSDPERLKTLPFADESATNVQEVFRDLGFDIDRHDNCTKTDILDKLKDSECKYDCPSVKCEGKPSGHFSVTYTLRAL